MNNVEQYRYDFSVVIPAFDEEENIDTLMNEIQIAFSKYGLNGEVVFVDDGSNDDTFKRAVFHKESMKCLKVVRHHRNLGKTEAIVNGVQHSESPLIIILDADLQYSPEEIPRFIQKLNEGYDLVTGKKIGSYGKNIVSYIYNWFCQKLFSVPVTDMNSMKAFRKEILDEIHLRHDWHRFLVVLSYCYGFTVTEIDVKLRPRKYGNPKYSGYGRIIIGVLDLLSVKFKIAFSRKPLLFFGTIGLFLIFLGFITGLVAIYMRIFLNEGFRPLLYLVMLFMIIGCISFIGGLIGEIIGDLTDRLEHITKKSNKDI